MTKYIPREWFEAEPDWQSIAQEMWLYAYRQHDLLDLAVFGLKHTDRASDVLTALTHTGLGDSLPYQQYEVGISRERLWNCINAGKRRYDEK